MRGRASIVGCALSPVGKVPGRSPLWLAADASRKALADAGLTKADVESLFSD